MWFLVIVLFLLTCLYSKMQYRKIKGYYDELHYDIVEIQNNLNKSESEDSEEN